VRKLLLYGFLGLMCYHLLGFFTYFEWKRYAINKQIKHELKHAVPDSQLIQFHFTHHEINQLKWVKSHEFILNGHYYDVLKKEKTKHGFFFHCISDDQETTLFKQLKSMTSFNLSHSGKDQPVNVWFKFLSEPMEVLQSIEIDYGQVDTQVSSGLTSYEEWSYSSCLSTETPPPDFIS
jgi:hypothetical protein